MLSRRGSGCLLTIVRMTAFGALLPVLQASRSGKCCPLSVIPSFASGGRGDQKAAVRTGLLHMLLAHASSLNSAFASFGLVHRRGQLTQLRLQLFEVDRFGKKIGSTEIVGARLPARGPAPRR